MNYKKKWYSERRRKPGGTYKYLKENGLSIRRNDTLKGDGNSIPNNDISKYLIKIRRNDTLKGDGNIMIYFVISIVNKKGVIGW